MNVKAWLMAAGGLVVGVVATLVLTQSDVTDGFVDTAEPGSPASSDVYRVSDFEVDVRVTEKQCYGDAGCNVTVGLEPKYVGADKEPDGTWEVTYEISGDESGPIIQTFEVTGDEMSFTDSADLSTPSSTTEPAADITSVRKVP